jgi:hypothetical protein
VRRQARQAARAEALIQINMATTLPFHSRWM